MNSLGQNEPPAEPDRKLVERAIVKVLEIAQDRGVTPTDFIQMLDSGVPLSDFLDAINMSTKAGCAIGSGSSWGNPALLD